MNQADVIDEAVKECVDYIETRKRQCKAIMWYQLALVRIGFLFFGFFVYYSLMPTREPAADLVSSPAASNQEALDIGAWETGAREIDGASPSEVQNGESHSMNGDTSDKVVSGDSNSIMDNESPRVTGVEPTLATTMIIALAGLYGVAATVLMASFRSFHRDIDRAQRTKIGFLRIRVAGEKTEDGYQGEVRRALTEGTFIFPEEYLSGRGKKGIDLFPGHPIYEILKRLLKAMENRG